MSLLPSHPLCNSKIREDVMVQKPPGMKNVTGGWNTSLRMSDMNNFMLASVLFKQGDMIIVPDTWTPNDPRTRLSATSLINLCISPLIALILFRKHKPLLLLIGLPHVIFQSP